MLNMGLVFACPLNCYYANGQTTNSALTRQGLGQRCRYLDLHFDADWPLDLSRSCEGVCVHRDIFPRLAFRLKWVAQRLRRKTSTRGVLRSHSLIGLVVRRRG